jgi:3-oxoacyl-[acyl-carrier protein] reductase
VTVVAERVVIVTGAGRGLGREYARLFAADGANVVVADVDLDGANETVADIRAASGNAIAVKADVTAPDSVESLVTAAIDEFGTVHVLVNNAGIWGDLQRVPLVDIDPAYWDLVMAVNVRGPLLCSRAVIPSMRAQQWGRIVNISSIGAWMPSGVYGVSKLALNQLTFAMASEIGDFGITVNAVAPGTIDNEATQRQVPKAGLDGLVNRNAIKRSGTAADLYGMIRYLASDEAEWVTGQTIAVNGGFGSRL